MNKFEVGILVKGCEALVALGLGNMLEHVEYKDRVELDGDSGQIKLKKFDPAKGEYGVWNSGRLAIDIITTSSWRTCSDTDNKPADDYLSREYIKNDRYTGDILLLDGPDPTVIRQIIEDHPKSLEWFHTSFSVKVPIDLLDKYSSKLNWDHVSKYQDLNVEFIKKYSDEINWRYLCEANKSALECVDEMEEFIKWETIARYQALSEDFIMKHKSKLPWDRISYNKNISDDIKRKCYPEAF